MNGVVVDQDLEAIAVVIDSDGRVESIEEQPFKCYSLITTPRAIGTLAVKDDRVVRATDADVEKVVVAGTHDIDGGVIKIPTSAGSQVQFRGPEDDNVPSPEFFFQGDSLVNGKEVRHDWICWVSCRSMNER